MSFVILDGKLLPETAAHIPVRDRGFLFGDGVYTTICVKGGAPHFLEEHILSLKRHCQQLGLSPPSISPFSIEQLLVANGASEGMWKLKILITGGRGKALTLSPREAGHLLLTVEPFTPLPFKPLRITCFPHPILLPYAAVKTLAHLHRFYVMEYACQTAYDDALTLTPQGEILETSFGNLFWIFEETLYCPSRELPLYFGMTLSQLIKGCPFPVCEVRKTLAQIPGGAFVFRTNTLSGILPIVHIGERNFSRHEALEKYLLGVYENLCLKSQDAYKRVIGMQPSTH